MIPTDLLDLPEPEIPLDDEPAIALDEPEVAIDQASPVERAEADAPSALMQVLPAGFPLPGLIRFCPDVRLKTAAEQAAAYALSLDVRGSEGLQAVDTAITVLRTSQKGIEAHFVEPVEIANELHKRLTGLRSEWLATGKNAIEVVGRRIYVEKQRLDAIAAEERRKAQDEANRLAREEARREAEAAAKAKAPAAVVEQLERQAKIAVAPPVAAPATAPVLRGTTTVENWTCTITGTPRDAEQHPAMADLTDAQRVQVLDLMRAVVDGKAPIACFELSWPYLSKRAKADKSTLAIPGIEAYDGGGVRAKGTRSK